VDVNQQLFASGRQPGALGSMGAGEVDAKRSAIPLLAVVLGFKDSAGYLRGFDSPGFTAGGVNGIGGAFTPKSGDKVIQAFQNLADVPPELEWLANITNPKTRRFYKTTSRNSRASPGCGNPRNCALSRARMSSPGASRWKPAS
jgi:hypothetical protein